MSTSGLAPVVSRVKYAPMFPTPTSGSRRRRPPSPSVTIVGLVSRFAIAIAVVTAVVGIVTTPVAASHGPGTSGGGAETVSGQTLGEGKYSLTLQSSFTDFEHVPRADAEAQAAISGGFDALGEALVTTASYGFGVTDNLQIGADLGYYRGNDFVEAAIEEGGTEPESHIGDPKGFTDLSLTAKLRVIQGNPAHVSLFGSVIVPVGKDNARLDNGELLEASSQPGTGAWGYTAGVAASWFLSAATTVNASAAYTYRDAHRGFQVGDRVQAGTAIAHRFRRLQPGGHKLPRIEAFIEALAVSLGRDKEETAKNPNSGGTTLYVGPGIRARLSEAFEVVVSPAWPVMQNLSGAQVEADFKARAALTWYFQ